MKYPLALYLLFIAILSHGQTIPSTIRTAKTAAYVNIPTTKVFLIAPEGFIPSQELPSIEKGQDGMIQAANFLDASFSSDSAHFNRKDLEAQGFRMLDYKEFTINGYSARLALLQGRDGTSTYRMLFGDTSFSVLLMGTFVQTDNKTGSEILKSMLTVYYDKSFKPALFEQTLFTLDDTHTRLKFAKYSGGGYIYSFNGHTEGSDDNPILIVNVMPADATMPELMADILLGKLREAGLNIVSSENPVTEKVNGLPSFHREVYVMMNEKKILMYLQVVIIDHTAIVLQGQTSSNFSTYLQDFRALISTIRKK